MGLILASESCSKLSIVLLAFGCFCAPRWGANCLCPQIQHSYNTADCTQVRDPHVVPNGESSSRWAGRGQHRVCVAPFLQLYDTLIDFVCCACLIRLFHLYVCILQTQICRDRRVLVGSASALRSQSVSSRSMILKHSSTTKAS